MDKPAAKSKRSGSETRKASARVTIRLTPEQDQQLNQWANDSGLGSCSYVRAKGVYRPTASRRSQAARGASGVGPTAGAAWPPEWECLPDQPGGKFRRETRAGIAGNRLEANHRIA